LLNLRNFDRSAHLEEAENSSVFKPNGQLLYVVDGQHRIEALTKLMEEDPGKWADYTVPFVCMLGASESEEMSQFYVVNSTAKSVRTDLALDLLKQQAENDPNVYTALVQKGEDWKVEAQTLTEKLDKTRLWKHRIRFPGEPKAETTLSSSGMVSSLKQLLGTPFFSQISTENRMKILEAYWEGIRDILPDPFEDPTAYALQKSSGVIIVHSLLVQVLELLRSKGWSLVEAQSYEEVLREALLALEGDTAEGETARGSDFWLSGSRGAVGSFSSNAGRRVLGARLKNDLPQFEIE
jgi:DGQHR domain-containing protein